MNPTPWLIGFLALALPLGAQPVSLSTRAGGPAPVVLELFTSQGCSSCPPAEALLGTWGLGQFTAGKLLPLAFHVDYWNDLGWVDPFSSADATGRQRDYARALGRDSLYTPQAVLGGQVDAVGSDAKALRERLAALSTRRAVTGLEISAARQGKSLKMTVETQGTGAAGGDWVLCLAVFENGLVTKVPRGENRGRDLEGAFVVRSFQKAYPAPASGVFSVDWDPAWDPARTGVAAFLQDRRSLLIDSAAAVFPLR